VSYSGLRPDKSAIELEDRDIQISVHGLLTAIMPNLLSVSNDAIVCLIRDSE